MENSFFPDQTVMWNVLMSGSTIFKNYLYYLRTCILMTCIISSQYLFFFILKKNRHLKEGDVHKYTQKNQIFWENWTRYFDPSST